MIHALLADLGNALARRQGAVAPVDFVRETLPDEYSIGIAIVFGSQSSRFIDVRLKEFSESERRCVLYRKGPPNGADPVPVSCLTEPAKTCRIKLSRSLAGLAEWCERKRPSEAPRFHALSSAFESACEEAAAAVTEKVRSARLDPKTRRAFLFVALEEDGRTRAVYDDPIFSEYLPEVALSDWRRKSETSCRLASGSCAVCLAASTELCGNFSELACFHHDEPSMVAGGCDAARAARNFPVCAACALAVARGLDFARRELRFRAGSMEYLLLPRTSEPAQVDLFLKRVPGHEPAHDRQTHEGKPLLRFTDDEREMLEELGEDFPASAPIAFELAFYRRNQAQWHLLGEIAEVLPSRLHRIFEAKKACEAMPGIGRTGAIRLSSVRRFCSRSGPRTGDDSATLRTLEAIFAGASLDRGTVLHGCSHTVLSAFRDSLAGRRTDWPWTASNALVYLEFLRKLEVVRAPLEASTMPDTLPDVPATRFLRDHGPTFWCTELRISFLTGTLVSSVLYVQRTSLGKQPPFLKKLHGLRMDRRRLTQLAVTAKDKLIQYDAAGLARGVEEALALEWASAPRDWRPTADETSLAFALGLTLGDRLAKKTDSFQAAPTTNDGDASEEENENV